ncbi:MAG: proline iminopeptidase-family hydrolase [Bacilli bacterium]|nr:proline iminopeptidase-family hydrolase [Bacilli bacterium]
MPQITKIPYRKYHTCVYIYGSLSSKRPVVIILHGGPGGNTAIYRPLTDLVKYGYTVVLYDQLGCGKSSSIRGHEELYTMATYVNELNHLLKYLKIKNYYLIGHSWGGMLALSYIHQYQPTGLKKLVLFSSLYSTKAWNETNLERCLSLLKGEDKKYWLNCYKNQSFSSQKARRIFKEKLLPHYKNKTNTSPYPYRKYPHYDGKFIYRKMWGSNDMFGFGTLLNWDESKTLKQIKVPTLILCGRYDQSRLSMNQKMQRAIKGSQLVYLTKSAHCGYFNEYHKSLSAISKFFA